MFKKILISFGLVSLIAVLTAANIDAYAIDPSYRPINSPFNLDFSETDADLSSQVRNTITILQILAGALLYFAAPIAILIIVWEAFVLITGGSDSEKVDQAKKQLTWAILGLLVIILSYSLARGVIEFIITAATPE